MAIFGARSFVPHDRCTVGITLQLLWGEPNNGPVAAGRIAAIR
jgi:hypothetical protein